MIIDLAKKLQEISAELIEASGRAQPTHTKAYMNFFSAAEHTLKAAALILAVYQRCEHAWVTRGLIDTCSKCGEERA